MKKIPLSVASMAKAYGLEMEKGSLDSQEGALSRPRSHARGGALCSWDVRIVAEVLRHQYEEGLDSMTSSADALKMFKASIGGEDEFGGCFRSSH